MNNPRIPGRVRGKPLSKRVHVRNRFRCYGDGYALAVSKLRDAKAHGAEMVELIEIETNCVLRVPLDAVLAWQAVEFPGYEPQRVLPLHDWRIEDPGQLDMFGGQA